MTLCNSTQIKRAYNEFLKGYGYTSLFECYARPSSAKVQAYEYCNRMYRLYDGSDFRILSYNTFNFTVGFVGTINGKKAFFYITSTYDRYMYID